MFNRFVGAVCEHDSYVRNANLKRLCLLPFVRSVWIMIYRCEDVIKSYRFVGWVIVLVLFMCLWLSLLWYTTAFPSLLQKIPGKCHIQFQVVINVANNFQSRMRGKLTLFCQWAGGFWGIPVPCRDCHTLLNSFSLPEPCRNTHNGVIMHYNLSENWTS